MPTTESPVIVNSPLQAIVSAFQVQIQEHLAKLAQAQEQEVQGFLDMEKLKRSLAKLESEVDAACRAVPTEGVRTTDASIAAKVAADARVVEQRMKLLGAEVALRKARNAAEFERECLVSLRTIINLQAAVLQPRFDGQPTE